MAIMKISAVLLIIGVVAMAPPCHGIPDNQSPADVEHWFRRAPNAKPKLTKLHFYLNNFVSRFPPASAVVAKANTTDSTPITSFGRVTVLDAPLTVRPGDYSEVIGYAQGLFTFASQEERATLMTLNFVLTTGKFSGSTLSVLGHNRVRHQYREFPIIGGSGDFRLAQGAGVTSSAYVNETLGDDILEMSFVFYRYVLPGDTGYDAADE